MKAQLKITASRRAQITYLQQCFVTPPFKVADITEDKTDGDLQLMLMSSSPGILDGDNFELELVLQESCHVQLHTQSYQRLFSMQSGAMQIMNVHLHKHASFVYLPHPSVPHEGSVFKAINNIYLQENGRLIWGEILTCGRQLKGEVFNFSKYHSLTKVFINNRLVIKENLFLQPSLMDVSGMGQLEGYTHQASLIYLEENTSVVEMGDAVHEYLEEQTEIIFGITKTACSGLLVRILGFKAEQLHHCLKQISHILLLKKEMATTPF